MRRWTVLFVLFVACGCENFAETVSCANGTVLNEDDDCVPPPVPDGGVTIVDCTDLCEAIAGWEDEQLGCLVELIGSFGPAPAECTDDITELSTCSSCITAARANDEVCATAGSTCQ